MPQSLAQLHIHLVFSTKHREPLVDDAVRDHLHAYMATVLNNLRCSVLLINSVEDHAHILLNVEHVRAYIAHQREHHTRRTFQEEYREFLVRHGIDFDERYVWD